MKKLYFLLAWFCLPHALSAQYILFGDDNLKAKLLSASASNPVAFIAATASYGPIDTNGNGEIEYAEAEAVERLELASSNISWMGGIEYFTNLKRLNFHNNNVGTGVIDYWDVPELPYLEDLDCSQNQIHQLNINPSLANLNRLNCSQNQLNYLDVTLLPNLKHLICNLNNLYQVWVNPGLEELYSPQNDIFALDLSSAVNLNYLNVQDNALTDLDLTHNPALTHINIADNPLVNLAMAAGPLPLIATFWCQNTNLPVVDFSQMPALHELICGGTDWTTLDLSLNTGLASLECNEMPQLTTLNIKNGATEQMQLEFSGNPSLHYICADDNQLADVQNKIAAYGYANCTLNSYCSFTPGGVYYTVVGATHFDSDGNGCDATDISCAHVNFNLAGNSETGNMIADATGNYAIPLSPGIHTLTPVLENPGYFNVIPPYATVDFPSSPSPFQQDFCLSANGTHADLEMALIPLAAARPGFDSKYKLVCRNKGSVVQSGVISFSFDDSVADFVDAVPAVASQSPNTAVWSFSGLQPFHSTEITLTLNLNSPSETPALNAGETLSFTASATGLPDETLQDNTALVNQTVVSSLDPNNKTCTEGDIVGLSTVGDYVHYVIRFENTGTANAQNIVVKDMIDAARFDVNTLVPLTGSAPFTTRISSGNKVEFMFQNINLPFQSGLNDGYVVFKIKTKPNLVVGDTFSNSASIYFDYNFPVLTNTATTTVQLLGTPDLDFSDRFTLYPNPAKDVVNIRAKDGVEIRSSSVYNMSGQLLMSVTGSESINVSSLASGNYFVKVYTGKGAAVSKFVKD
jgi:hypothetical protein